MSKFYNGDRFEVKDSGKQGTIIGTSYNSILNESEYYIEWDYFPGQKFCYAVDDVDNIWEKLGELHDANVKTPYSWDMHDHGVSLPSGISVEKTECEHNYVDIGFNYPKMVCSKCDKERS